MGIYDSGFNFGFAFDRRKIVPVIGAIAVIILVVALAYFALENFEISPLGFRFEKNPIKPGEQTKLFITVANNTENDARDVTLSLTAKESTEFDIYPLNEKFDGTIAVLSKGTSREITYLINPVGEVLPGTYTLVAKTSINGLLSEKDAILVVEN